MRDRFVNMVELLNMGLDVVAQKQIVLFFSDLCLEDRVRQIPPDILLGVEMRDGAMVPDWLHCLLRDVRLGRFSVVTR